MSRSAYGGIFGNNIYKTVLASDSVSYFCCCCFFVCCVCLFVCFFLAQQILQQDNFPLVPLSVFCGTLYSPPFNPQFLYPSYPHLLSCPLLNLGLSGSHSDLTSHIMQPSHPCSLCGFWNWIQILRL